MHRFKSSTFRFICALASTLVFGNAFPETAAAAHFYQVTAFADGTAAVSTGGHTGIATDPYLAPSLRSAVIAANSDPGSTIVLGAGVYSLTLTSSGTSELSDVVQNGTAGELDITGNNLTIQGAAGTTASQVTIQQTLANEFVLDVNPLAATGFNFTLSGVTIKGGTSTIGGGAISAIAGGGSPVTGPTGTVTITGCAFVNNSAVGGDLGSPGVGGAIAQLGGNLVVTSCTFSGNACGVNAAYPGGGGAIYFDASTSLGKGTLTVLNSTFSNNTAGGSNSGGGALQLIGATSYSVTGCVFQNNTATASSGGAIALDSGTATISRCAFLGNSVTSTAKGGAIYSSNTGSLTLSYCRISGNTAAVAANGTAIYQQVGGVFSAEENWWGANALAANTIVGGTVTKRLQLALSSGTANLSPSGTTGLQASFLTDSVGGAVSGANLTVFDGLSAAFAPTSGSLGLVSSIQTFTSGLATAIFTAANASSESASATVDSQSVSAGFTVVLPPAITSANTFAATQGNPRTFTVTTAGAPLPALSASGSLPAGATFVDNGNGTATLAVSGTVAASGTFPITIIASNGVPPNTTQAFSLVVFPALAISPATLPANNVGRAYNQTVTVTGGGTPYASVTVTGFAAGGTGFSAPTTNTAAGTVTVSGIPTGSGTASFTANVTDSTGATANKSYTVTINPALTVATATLPNWTANKTGYGQTISTLGGTAPVSLGVSGGTLPGGLTLSGSTLAGTPSASGTFGFTVSGTDAAGATASQAYTVVVNPALSLSPASLPNWTANKSGYSQTITPSGGTGAIVIGVSAGTLPTGLSLTGTTLSGTPSASGTFNFTVSGTDSVGATGSQAYSVVVNPAVTLSPSSLPNWTANKSGYSQTIVSNGGTGVIALGLSGTLPTGLSLSGSSISGTPTVSGTYNFTVSGTDTVGATGSQAYSVIINSAPSLSPASLPNWTVNKSGYIQTIVSSGGTGLIPLGLSGTIPTGLTLSGSLIAGMPNTAGTFNFTVSGTDTVGATTSRAYTVIVSPAVTLAPSTLPNWTANKSGYSQTITPSGGTGAVALGVSAGALPTGLTLSGSTIAGTPTAAGTYNFTVSGTDTVGATGSQAFSVIINAAVALSPSSLPNWTANKSGYSQTIVSNGGTGAITLGLSGTLPTGLILSGSSISGTPTVSGTYNFTVSGTDTVGAPGSQAYSVIINPAPSLSPASLPNWTVNKSGYSQTIVSSGGTGLIPLGLTGTIPTGLTLSGSLIVGTPNAVGTFNFTVSGTDTVGATTSRAYAVIVSPAVALSPGTLPNWTANKSGYSQTITPSGGTGTVALGVSTGGLPAGLAFVGGTLSGTPAASGTYSFTVTGTDTVGATGSQAYTVTINPAVAVSPSSLANWTAGKSGYSQTVSSSGGTGVVNLGVSVGSLPTGLTLTGSNLSGTPSASGTYNFTVTGTDTVNATGSQAYTVTINPALALLPSSLPNWTANKAGYSQTVSSSGGTGAVAFGIGSGALPPGLTLSGGVIAGTPNTSGSYSFTVSGTDTVGATASKSYSILIAAPVTVAPATLQNWTAGKSGYAQTVSSAGGTGVVTIGVSSGGLPTGLVFSGSSLNGTPLASGTYGFTLTGTDTVGATGSQAYSVTINPAVTIVTGTLPDWGVHTAGYSQTLSTNGGTGSLGFAVTSGTLPTGIALSGPTLSGSPTVVGVYNFTVTATDTVGATGAKSFTVRILPGPATHFSASAPGSSTAGTSFNVIVTALDAWENVATAYSGTTHFTSTDTVTTYLPADSKLTSGAGTFPTTLVVAGTQTITVKDTASASISGTSGNITVHAAAANRFSVKPGASSVTAGSPLAFTVDALDAYDNTAVTYSGTAHFASNDPKATFPTPFAPLTSGTGAFSVTLKTSGSRAIAASDSVFGLTGTSTSILVNPAAPSHFSVTPSTLSTTAGEPLTFSVSALDPYDNIVPAYSGTAGFTTSDPASGVLAATSGTLTAGTGSFGATLKTSGSQTISAFDSGLSISGTSAPVVVAPAAATHITVTAPASTVAGVSFAFEAIARDPFENRATGYTGTLHITSDDSRATLPSDSTLTSGSGAFSATLILASSARALVATDTETSSITGFASLTVLPAAAARFAVVAPSNAVDGTAFDFTVTAFDAFDNIASGYSGPITFASTNTGATLPGKSALTTGTGVFEAVLRSSGSAGGVNEFIAANDGSTPTLGGTSAGIYLQYIPPVATDDVVTITGRTAVNIRVLANDRNPSNASLTVSQVTRGRFGTATIQPDNTVTYMPSAAFLTNPSDVVYYLISDGRGNYSRASITIYNVVVGARGGYDGLFAETRTAAFAGYLNLVVDDTRHFTGTLHVSGSARVLTGAFDSAGRFQTRITRPGARPLSLGLAVDVPGGRITAQLTDGIFTATTNARRGVPAGDRAGTSTVLLLATGTSASEPQGTGWATMSVSPAGNITVHGELADGTAFTSRSFLKSDNTFVLFSDLYGPVAANSGRIAGVVTFGNQAEVSDAAGKIAWIKPAQHGTAVAPRFKNGFKTALDVLVSVYKRPPTGTRVLAFPPTIDNGRVVVTGGNLPAARPIVKTITLNGLNTITVTGPGADKLALTLNLADGTFRGTFVNPVTRLTTPLQGVVFQKQDLAAGYFLAPAQSGSVEIGSPKR